MSESAVAYIYVLKCQSKVYVGSARNGMKRIQDHFWALKNSRHENPYLQRAWNKYGEGEFRAEVVAICALEHRWEIEQQWIDRLNACDRKRGFNVMHSVQKLLPSEQMSKKLKKYWKRRWEDPEYKEKRTKELADLSKKPGVREKMQAAKLASWADPNYRGLLVAKHKEYASKPVNKARLSKQATNSWADPEYRAKQMAERKARFANPEFIAKLSLAAKNRKRRLTHNEIV